MRLRLCFQIICVAFLACISLRADVINGGFEAGDLTGWVGTGDVAVSPGFDYTNLSVLGPLVFPEEGNFAARLTAGAVDMAELSSLLGVSAEVFNASGGVATGTSGSMIQQTVSAIAGQVLRFRWNFVTADYLPFDDWAYFAVAFEGNPAVLSNLATVAPFGRSESDTDIEETGWQTFSVNITQSGSYTFSFGVVNGEDNSLNSELWVDAVSLGDAAVPEPGVMVMVGLPLLAILIGRRRKSASGK